MFEIVFPPLNWR